MADGADDGEDQAESRDRLARPLAEPGPRLHRKLQRRQVEHQMRRPGAQNAEGELDDDIGGGVAPAAARAREAATRLTAGFICAPEIGPSMVISTNRIAPVASVLPSSATASFPRRQMLGHDPRADHAGEQEEGADAFRRQPSRQRRLITQAQLPASPISRSRSAKRHRVDAVKRQARNS